MKVDGKELLRTKPTSQNTIASGFARFPGSSSQSSGLILNDSDLYNGERSIMHSTSNDAFFRIAKQKVIE